MAEGILRHALADAGITRYAVASAGAKPAGYVHPLAVEVMQEIGIDLAEHTSKSWDLFLNAEAVIDTAITVCGRADQTCPQFPGQRNRYHWTFDDPADAEGTKEEQLLVFRRVRDEIAQVFQAYAQRLKESA